jgi:uncharacterized protein (TIGR02118 family)
MVSYFVSYRGASPAATEFLRHYRDRHAEILRGFPGIRGLVLHTPVDWTDPYPVNPGGRILLAQMQFDSVAALDGALASEARAQARADFRTFPAFEGTVTHQAMASTATF